ncbi:hypothetical protein [Mesorhizobium sp. M8A.F.Ca.ET.165.01.1.1]|uniref:phage adaptor protein n=1 Tax=Mesorhizobium sp. M8A.F.Ca.ET.165.01.1.1 TaxID=2563960 RepID=UPI001093A17D|nr:hypothetical protein [Mesorhizobium sp. M8A.F.Ca.ET.165.01.1.1]TGT42778.1 hypothetical protein EN808_12920 [Mesorhizobium sp. M8A.F.Ca.ET.165.01.1.1]
MTTVKELALVGVGDGSDDDRLLRYMNLVYKEAYRRTAAIYPTLLLSQNTVTITDGAGVMSDIPFKVESVKDSGNGNRLLSPTTLPNLEDCHPNLSDVGSPSWYYFTGAKAIATYPVNSTTVKVRFIKSSGTLGVNDAENAILIPAEFHDLLIWGTLFYLAYDERDKAAGPEVQIAQSKYEIALADFTTWLTQNQPGPSKQTKAVLAS